MQPVIIVAHGSRNRRWVDGQLAFFAAVKALLPADAAVDCCFLEMSQPAFADQLERCRAEGIRPAILPFFLSRSGHAGDEIPEMADHALGHGNWDLITPEGWEQALARNTARRLAEYGLTPADQIIVSGYGASRHDHLWRELLTDVQRLSGPFSVGAAWWWAPSGHFLADYHQPLRDCLELARQQGLPRVGVLPLYLAVSSYQEELIPSVAAEFPALRVLYHEDAILPDADIAAWAAGRIADHWTTKPAIR